MLFHTTREAYSYAQRARKEKEKDIVVFETKTAFGVCFENEFFEKGLKEKSIVCYLAHPKYETRIKCNKDFYDEFCESRDIRLTFNYRRK